MPHIIPYFEISPKERGIKRIKKSAQRSADASLTPSEV